MDKKEFAEDLQDKELESHDSTEQSEESEHSEKMLPVSRVNQLIQKAKRDGEKKMQQQLEEAQAQLQQMQNGQGNQQPQQAAPQSMGGMQQLSPEQIQQQIADAVKQTLMQEQKARQQEQLQKEVQEVADRYYSKMNSGKDLYEDFDAVTADFDPAAFPSLVYLANEFDNTPAIIYELQKNPSKLASLAVLVEKSPQMARTQLNRLSQSIQENLKAKNEEQDTQEPLNRMKPSTVGADTGKMGIRDLKKADFLRV